MVTNKMQENFTEIEKILRKLAAARAEFKQTISSLDASAKDYNSDYVREYIEPKKQQARETIKSLDQTYCEKVDVLLRDIESLAVEKSNALDLSNPAWTNALKMLDSKISGETAQKINKHFEGDQAALRALREIYKDKANYDGGLDRQIYEPETEYRFLRELSYATFIQDGSLNTFANRINKVATFAGIQFPNTIDEPLDAAANMARKAAGL